MTLKIKNYTSEVPADRSVAMIETILIDLGATRIHKGYKDGQLESLSFSIKIGESVVPFQLPAQVDPIEAMFMKARANEPTQAQRINIRKQAERTAWKLIYDWVLLQATMIRLQQAEFVEVFLPYVYHERTGKTFFKGLKETNYKALLG